jgi:hypothetical protein
MQDAYASSDHLLGAAQLLPKECPTDTTTRQQRGRGNDRPETRLLAGNEAPGNESFGGARDAVGVGPR